MSAELNGLILQKDPAALPGSKGYMTHIQECLTTLVKGLSEQQQEEFAALAQEWNTAGVDIDKQAKCIAPVRYHLKEWGRTNIRLVYIIHCNSFDVSSLYRPKTKEELFNLRHASARNVIERIFGVLKCRF